MSQEAIALWGLAISILGLAITMFVKGPKEMNGELAAEIRCLREEQGVNATLTARHDERIGVLIQAIRELTQRIDRLEPFVKQNGRGRG